MMKKQQIPAIVMAVLMVSGLLLVAFNTPIASAAGALETPTYFNPYNVTATPSADGALYHTVLEGQSPYAIATLYGIDVATLLDNNSLAWDSVINIGDVLLIRNANERLPGEVVVTPTPTVNSLNSATQPVGGVGTADTVGSLGAGVNGTAQPGSLGVGANGGVSGGSLGLGANGGVSSGTLGVDANGTGAGAELGSSANNTVLGGNPVSGVNGAVLGDAVGSGTSQDPGAAAEEASEDVITLENKLKNALGLNYEQLRATMIGQFSQAGVLVNIAGTPVPPELAMSAALNGQAYILLPTGEAGMRTATAVSGTGVGVLTVGEQQALAIPAIQAVALAPESEKQAKSVEVTPNLVERIFSNNTKYLALAVILMVLIGLLLLVISTHRLRE